MSTDPRPRYDDLVRIAAEAGDEEAAAQQALDEAEGRLGAARENLSVARRAIRDYIDEDVYSLRTIPYVGVRAVAPNP